MSQFEGSKLKVRCVDCTKFSGGSCVARGLKTTPKKKRRCGVYEFKGEYENRTPPESVYVPHVDPKTKRLIKKLLKMGVVPVAEDGSVDIKDGFARTKSFAMPASTATADAATLKSQLDNDPILYKPTNTELDDAKLIWTPGDEYDEPEDSRGR